MLPIAKQNGRLGAALLAISCLPFAMASSAIAGQEVGHILAVQGNPQVRTPTGANRAIKLNEQLAPGAIIVLRAKESIRFCHESSSKTFRVEGAGSVQVGDVGINTEIGGPNVAIVGGCPASSTPSETGGVLLRTIRPPASPK